jgi:hypothetical protein
MDMELLFPFIISGLMYMLFLGMFAMMGYMHGEDKANKKTQSLIDQLIERGVLQYFQAEKSCPNTKLVWTKDNKPLKIP